MIFYPLPRIPTLPLFCFIFPQSVIYLLLSDPQQVSKARVFLVFFKREKYFFSETEKKKDKLGATFLGSLTDPEAQVLTRMKSKAKSIATPTENSIMNALKILTTMEFQKLLYGIFVADLHGLFPKHSWKACYTLGGCPQNSPVACSSFSQKSSPSPIVWSQKTWGILNEFSRKPPRVAVQSLMNSHRNIMEFYQKHSLNFHGTFN